MGIVGTWILLLGAAALLVVGVLPHPEVEPAAAADWLRMIWLAVIFLVTVIASLVFRRAPGRWPEAGPVLLLSAVTALCLPLPYGIAMPLGLFAVAALHPLVGGGSPIVLLLPLLLWGGATGLLFWGLRTLCERGRRRRSAAKN